MNVFLAGGTGAIGRPLVERLRERGHKLTAMTRSSERAARLYKKGIEAITLDPFDAAAVRTALERAKPDVVVHQLTSLPTTLSRHARHALGETNRLRAETVPLFVDAAAAAGARRVVVQSICFVTRPEGADVQSEEAPLWLDGPPEAAAVVSAVQVAERAALETPGVEGVVLRYGFFYGPGTWFSRDGAVGALIAKRRLPLVGDGRGRMSFVHVDDAADATVLAIDRGPPGIYNVCDDEPLEQNEWLPAIAQDLGARPPRRVPVWLARPLVGPLFVHYATTLKGASNARVRRELGWRPRSWRSGFRQVFTAL